YLEAIIARSESCVERLSSVARVYPRRVDAFELIAKLHALGALQTEPDIVDLQAGGSCGELRHREILRTPIDGDRLDADHRWNRVSVKMSRIHPYHVVEVQEP